MTYLAKDGKVFGPYEGEQISQMKTAGDFYQYEWMWDGHSPDWTPVPRRLKSPPPLPDAPAGASVPTTPSLDASTQAAPSLKRPPAPSAQRPQVDIITSEKVFPAIVFDNRQSIGGEVSQAHSRGAKFISTPNAGSHFPRGAQIFVDVLDEQKDKSAKVKATIAAISREENRWVFEIEWQGMPLL